MSDILPYIFIFDIDNCIIGNVDYPIIECNLLEIIKMSCDSKNITKKCKKNINFVNELKKGLLRPYFVNFIKFIKKKYKNVELYVYTNSSYNWTHGGLVENIEKASGVKFNKPYFTRENSNFDLSKSLTNVYKIIVKNLVKKYRSLNNKNMIKELFKNKVVFIDNIKDNLNDYPEKQITCPSYDFNYPYDILKKVKKKYIFKNEIFKEKNIDKFIETNIKSPKFYKKQTNKITNLEKAKWNYFKKKDKSLNKKDLFYKKLKEILKKNKIDKFTNENIELINSYFTPLEI